MRYLRWVGLLPSLLIVGVLGGLTAPLPSEAMTLEIAGQQNVTVYSYTCETGYTFCWYLIDPITGTAPRTRTIGGWVVGDLTSSNRARLRIKDLSGAALTNVDTINLTGATFRPVTPNASTAVSMHVKITHTFTSGQNPGDYYWSMGVTGQFNPPDAENVQDDHFILTGTGTFNNATDSVSVGRIDIGAFRSPQIIGRNGVISSPTPVVATLVKTGCNTNSTGVCTPSILYDVQIDIKGSDVLELVDSLVFGGRTCTAVTLDPLIPTTWIPTMTWIDNVALPHIPLPTHVSGMHDWFAAENAKYIHNPLLRQAITDFETKLVNKWLANNTCTGKIIQVVTADQAAGAAANGQPNVTTCKTDNTCGTIVIQKTIAPCLTGYDHCWPIPQDSQTFNFDGKGSGIYSFSITTDGTGEAIGTGSYSINSLITGLDAGLEGGPRTIAETVFPTNPADPDRTSEPSGCGTGGSLCYPEAAWYTKSVSCTSLNSGTIINTALGTRDVHGVPPSGSRGVPPSDSIRGGSVTVSNLQPNDIVTCTFENGIYEYDESHTVISPPPPSVIN